MTEFLSEVLSQNFWLCDNAQPTRLAPSYRVNPRCGGAFAFYAASKEVSLGY